MTPEEIRLRCIEALISKSPQSPDVGSLIERAKVLTAYIVSDTPRGPGRPKGSTSIARTLPEAPVTPEI